MIMRYIRTKDEIIDLIALPNLDINDRGDITWYNNTEKYGHMIKYEDIIKTADTIEELGDCFIAVDKNGNLCENPMIAKGHCFKSFCNYYKANGIDVDCYLAILTDKGLIYVAKMKGVLPNGEIDWELL